MVAESERELATSSQQSPSTPAQSGTSNSRSVRAVSNSSGNSEYYGREMPQDQEAEMGVLGGMLMNKDAVVEVSQKLTLDDFYKPQHRVIYEAILDLSNTTSQIDPVIVAGHLDREGQLERVGGRPYIFTLMNKVPTAANAGYYADIVKEKSILRQLVSTGTHIVQYGYSGLDGADVEAVVDRAQQEVFEITNESAREDYKVLEDLMDSTMEEIQKLHEEGGQAMGLQTGFIDLDNLTNGLQGGQMIIIAARPGVGKSTLAMDIMRFAAIKQDIPSVLFSLEMSQNEVVKRILSAEASVPLSDMNGGRLKPDEIQRLANTMGRIEKAPLYIDDSSKLTMMDIRAKARALAQKNNLGLIVVDYLQLMSSGKKVESRQQEVSEFSRQLKLLAKEVNVPLIAISQLNRGVESRGENAKPRISDLRESGSLEQDADMVILLSRPGMEDPDSPEAGDAYLDVAKHRGGPTRTITVAQQLHYSRFKNLSRDEIPADK